ncbi:MAG: SMC-Scp complex subunit ScpB [Patescibacteria group bacterium]
MTRAAQQLEALLALAGESVSRRELSQLLKVSPPELQALIDEVAGSFAGHALAIVQTERDVELTTSREVGEWLAQVIPDAGNKELSRAAAETLAIVAYCGPVTRYEIDMLRGVDSRRMLRVLLGRGVVERISGQGRAPRYEITDDFLKHLGITRREELPRFQELSRQERVRELLHKDV